MKKRFMDTKLLKSLLRLGFVIIGCFILASFSPSLDGRAVVVDEGVFPQGLFAKTVGYLPGDIISVTNISGDTTIDILVIGALDPSEGVAIMLSPEAAAAIGIDKYSNNIVKITKRSNQDERVYGSAVIATQNNSLNNNSTFEEQPVTPVNEPQNQIYNSTDKVVEESFDEPVENIPATLPSYVENEEDTYNYQNEEIYEPFEEEPLEEELIEETPFEPEELEIYSQVFEEDTFDQEDAFSEQGYVDDNQDFVESETVDNYEEYFEDEQLDDLEQYSINDEYIEENQNEEESLPETQSYEEYTEEYIDDYEQYVDDDYEQLFVPEETPEVLADEENIEDTQEEVDESQEIDIVEEPLEEEFIEADLLDDLESEYAVEEEAQIEDVAVEEQFDEISSDTEDLVAEELIEEEPLEAEPFEDELLDDIISEEDDFDELSQDFEEEDFVSEEFEEEDFVPEEEEIAAEEEFIPEEMFIPESLSSIQEEVVENPEEYSEEAFEESIDDEVSEEFVEEEFVEEEFVEEEFIPEELENQIDDFDEEGIEPEENYFVEETYNPDFDEVEFLDDETDSEDVYEPIILVPTEDNPPLYDEAEFEPIEQPEDVVIDNDIEDIFIPEITQNANVIEEEPINTVIEENIVNNIIVGNETDYAKYMIQSLDLLEAEKYYIQIATLKEDENILEIVNKYGLKYPITIVPTSKGTKQILVGPVTLDEYATVLERFKSYGYKDAFLRKGTNPNAKAKSQMIDAK